MHQSDHVPILGLEAREAILHLLKLLRQVWPPVQDFTNDSERVARAIRLCRTARELLVGKVGIIHQGSGRLHDLDPPRTITEASSAPPGCGVERPGEIDPGQRLCCSEIGLVSHGDQVTRLQIGLRAMIKLVEIGLSSE